MIGIDLTGKRAIVTGAGQGLGKEIGLRLAEAGAIVYFADYDEEKSRRACQEGIERGGHCIPWKAIDVSSVSQMRELIWEVAGQGALDIMVNAAGIMYPDSLIDLDPEKLWRLEDVNINGTAYGTQYAMQEMMKQRSGRIVNIASIAGRHGCTTKPYYAMSKAAVINLTQSAALFGAKYGVNVNTVCPGIIHTAMWDQILDFMMRDTGKSREECWQEALGYTIPMGIEQEAIDIANAVLFLCSDMARYITAQSLNVDGGARMN